jgi:hypothetical protein
VIVMLKCYLLLLSTPQLLPLAMHVYYRDSNGYSCKKILVRDDVLDLDIACILFCRIVVGCYNVVNNQELGKYW